MVVREHAHRPHCTIQLGAPGLGYGAQRRRFHHEQGAGRKCGSLRHERRYIMHFSMLLQAVLLEEKQ